MSCLACSYAYKAFLCEAGVQQGSTASLTIYSWNFTCETPCLCATTIASHAESMAGYTADRHHHRQSACGVCNYHSPNCPPVSEHQTLAVITDTRRTQVCLPHMPPTYIYLSLVSKLLDSQPSTGFLSPTARQLPGSAYHPSPHIQH